MLFGVSVDCMEGGGCVGADLKRKSPDRLASERPNGTRRTHRAFPAMAVPGTTLSLTVSLSTTRHEFSIIIAFPYRREEPRVRRRVAAVCCTIHSSPMSNTGWTR